MGNLVFFPVDKQVPLGFIKDFKHLVSPGGNFQFRVGAPGIDNFVNGGHGYCTKYLQWG